ncbi:type II toxin-antitoxin system RelE/ParE family toxin [Candidatus Dojkabacteria bacterium]|uniref:Type II toxin-antitoxin system RelE/ParE family toxin n=1 Tax=Candidatus Dojkabacteria bacterium TaxID=2099670 RepID=A0A955L771_9BACT|nr:type II toxin-antitoxin system RelE/ParE family toxin [Candidatus Dojkabacteria bacterium]
MAQYNKEIYFDKSAHREYKKLPQIIRKQFDLFIEELAIEGKLETPDAKKLTGYNLYEMRVFKNDQSWRGIYTYLRREQIIILVFFSKKSNSTPHRYISTSLKRRKNHE